MKRFQIGLKISKKAHLWNWYFKLLDANQIQKPRTKSSNESPFRKIERRTKYEIYVCVVFGRGLIIIIVGAIAHAFDFLTLSHPFWELDISFGLFFSFSFVIHLCITVAVLLLPLFVYTIRTSTPWCSWTFPTLAQNESKITRNTK